MNLSYETMEEFKKISNRIDRQVRGVEKEKEKAQVELNHVEASYDKLIIDEATTGESIDKVEMNRLSQRKERLERDLAQFDDRIKVLEETRKDLLLDRVPDLHEAYKEKMDSMGDEIKNLRSQIIPKMSEYMALLDKIGRHFRGAHDIHTEFMNLTCPLTDKFEGLYRFGVRIPGPGLFISSWPQSVNSRRGVTEQEQINAVEGKGLPWPVALYNLTGEQEPNHSKAEQKYRKAKQEQAEKEER